MILKEIFMLLLINLAKPMIFFNPDRIIWLEVLTLR